MSTGMENRYQIDILSEQSVGCFAAPSEAELEYTDLFFSVCEQFDLRYYSAPPKERCFVDEVARVTWAHQHEQATGAKAAVRPAFAG